MKRELIRPVDLVFPPISAWLKKWFLLTAGSDTDFNSMTVAWGSIGTMWNRPFVQIVVRPARYTYEFLEKYDTFSLCAFSMEYRQPLQLLGTKSGRDSNKIKESGLTVMLGDKIATPGYDEAELILECRKIYYQDFQPDNFLDPKIERNYPAKDYHRIYFGEIVNVMGSSDYRK